MTNWSLVFLIYLALMIYERRFICQKRFMTSTVVFTLTLYPFSYSKSLCQVKYILLYLVRKSEIEKISGQFCFTDFTVDLKCFRGWF